MNGRAACIRGLEGVSLVKELIEAPINLFPLVQLECMGLLSKPDLNQVDLLLLFSMLGYSQVNYTAWSSSSAVDKKFAVTV